MCEPKRDHKDLLDRGFRLQAPLSLSAPFANAVLFCVAPDEKDHMQLTTSKSNQKVQALSVSATCFLAFFCRTGLPLSM